MLVLAEFKCLARATCGIEVLSQDGGGGGSSGGAGIDVQNFSLSCNINPCVITRNTCTRSAKTKSFETEI